MERMKIAAIFADQDKLGGKTVTVCGWARTIRDMKTFGFIELNDGSCFKNLQVVMDANTLDNYKEIAGQNVGAALIVTGTVVLTPQAKQPLEVKAAHHRCGGHLHPRLSPSEKAPQLWSILRTIQHLRPRTNLFSAAFRVRSVAAHAIHCFFQDRGFVYVHTPIITASDCEGRGRDVPGDHPGPEQRAQDRGRPGGLQPGLLRQAGQPHRVRPAQLPRTSPWPSATCTPSAPPSGRRTPTPSATPPSSG